MHQHRIQPSPEGEILWLATLAGQLPSEQSTEGGEREGDAPEVDRGRWARNGSPGCGGIGGRTLRRGRSSMFVRAAETVRRLDSDSSPAQAPTFNLVVLPLNGEVKLLGLPSH
jgi:hypothetical protein